MLSRTTIALSKNMKRNWTKGNSSFSGNTKRFMIDDSEKVNEIVEKATNTTVSTATELPQASPELSPAVDLASSTASPRAVPSFESPSNRSPVPPLRRSPDGYSGASMSIDSVFKTAFKYYKKRNPPPDLSEVIDIRTLPGTALQHTVSEPSVDSLGLRPLNEWKVVQFDDREGLYLIPDVLRDSSHLPWMERCLSYATPPNKTNIDLHSDEGFDVSRNPKSLRWTTLGVHYDWSTKEYPPEGRPLPSELVDLASIVSQVLGLGAMSADAAIVNYYPQKSTLSPHVDRSERTSAPLISLSIGRPCIYLTGGASLDDTPLPILLTSGDILVMSSSQRLVYHGVPATFPPGYRPSPLDSPSAPFSPIFHSREPSKDLLSYARNYRINVTIRQVNPK